jgi:hypothetical protein
MEKVGRNFLLLSAIYGVLGMGIGLYSAVHSHLTLFGFVSLAIYGLTYSAGLAKNDRLAAAHFWVSALGAILFPIGEGLAIGGGSIALAVAGSLLVILSAVQFVVAIYRA